jgi:hypothetical protein
VRCAASGQVVQGSGGAQHIGALYGSSKPCHLQPTIGAVDHPRWHFPAGVAPESDAERTARLSRKRSTLRLAFDLVAAGGALASLHEHFGHASDPAEFTPQVSSLKRRRLYGS